jgi:hypothetical protein
MPAYMLLCDTITVQPLTVIAGTTDTERARALARL